MKTSAEDSRVSDTWDSRKMMSSEQTETEVFGLFPKTQHLSPRSHAFTIFASSSLIKWGEKVVFLQNRAPTHYLLYCSSLPQSMSTCSQRKEGEKWGLTVKIKPFHRNIMQINIRFLTSATAIEVEHCAFLLIHFKRNLCPI